jgi:hypothetical protein
MANVRMIGFDYLHAARPALLRRVMELRIPARVHNPLIALAGAILVVTGAWGIEAYRLQRALQLEARYRQRFEESRLEVARTRIMYGRLERLVALDRRINRIVRSGDDDARRLAEIANRLPERAWLTSISHDSTGIALEGRAEDLTVVSRTVGALAKSRVLRNPTLVDASSGGNDGGEDFIRYQVHLDGTRP